MCLTGEWMLVMLSIACSYPGVDVGNVTYRTVAPLRMDNVGNVTY